MPCSCVLVDIVNDTRMTPLTRWLWLVKFSIPIFFHEYQFTNKIIIYVTDLHKFNMHYCLLLIQYWGSVVKQTQAQIRHQYSWWWEYQFFSARFGTCNSWGFAPDAYNNNYWRWANKFLFLRISEWSIKHFREQDPWGVAPPVLRPRPPPSIAHNHHRQLMHNN